MAELSDYSDFNDALDAIGSTETTLYIDADGSLSENETVPSTLRLVFINESILTIGSTYVLTVNGPLESPPIQIFDITSTGNVVLGGPTLEIFPEWWGIDGTSDQVEINAAIESISGTGGIIRLQAKNYVTSDEILFNDKRAIQFLGAGQGHPSVTVGTRIKRTGQDTSAVMRLNGVQMCSFENFEMDGGYTAVDVLHIEHLENSGVAATVSTGHLNFNMITIYNSATNGIRIGSTSEIQKTLANCNLSNLWIRETGVGIKFECDQAVNWFFNNLNFLDNTIDVQAGNPSSYGGALCIDGFFSHGASTFLKIDRIGGPVTVENGTLEDNGLIIDKDTSGIGTNDRNIILRNIFQVSQPEQSLKSAIYGGRENLIVEGCRWKTDFEVGHRGPDTAIHAVRTFISCVGPIKELNSCDYAHPQSIIEINKVSGHGTTSRLRLIPPIVDNSDNSVSRTSETNLAITQFRQNVIGPLGGFSILAAGTLNVESGDVLKLKLYYDTATFQFGAVTATGPSDWRFEANVYNTTTSTQRVSWISWVGNAIERQGYEEWSVDTTASHALKVTGQRGNTNSSLTQKMWKIQPF